MIPVTSHPTAAPPVLRSQSAGRSSSRRASAPTDLPTVPEEPSPGSAAAAGAAVGGELEGRKERIRSVSAGRNGSGASSKHTNYPQVRCICRADLVLLIFILVDKECYKLRLFGWFAF